MRRLFLLFSVATFLLSISVGAHAASYIISISGVDTGTLDVTSSGAGTDAGSVALSSGSGSIDGDAVVLVSGLSSWLVNSSDAPSVANYYTDPTSGIYFDDELYPSDDPAVDDIGLEFEGTGANSGIYFLLASSGAPPAGPAGVVILDVATGALTGNDDTITAAAAASAIPEPSSLMLLGTGVLGLAGAARRKLFAAA